VAGAMLLNAASKFAFYTASKAMEQQAGRDGDAHDFAEPKTFCKAFDHPDPVQCSKWRAAIHKEFCNMTNRGIWHKVKRM